MQNICRTEDERTALEDRSPQPVDGLADGSTGEHSPPAAAQDAPPDAVALVRRAFPDLSDDQFMVIVAFGRGELKPEIETGIVAMVKAATRGYSGTG